MCDDAAGSFLCWLSHLQGGGWITVWKKEKSESGSKAKTSGEDARTGVELYTLDGDGISYISEKSRRRVASQSLTINSISISWE